MRKIFLACFLLLLPMCQVYADVLNGLVGWWKLDDGAGASAADASGQGNAGTLVNTPTWTNNCKKNNCLQFNGSNTYVNIADASVLNPGVSSFSWSFWVKTSQDATSLSWPGIVAKEHNSLTTPRVGWMSTLSSFGGSVNKADCEIFYNGSGDSASTSSVINDNLWHHIACVRNVTANKLYVFRDGKLDVTTTMTNTGSNSVSNTNLLEIGGRNLTAVNSMLSGFVDDVRVYNRALSAGEVYDIFQSQNAIQFAGD